MKTSFFSLPLLVLLTNSSSGSPGDKSRTYQNCVFKCRQTNVCPMLFKPFHTTLDFHLKPNETVAELLTHNLLSFLPEASRAISFTIEQLKWDCTSECKYTCMEELSLSGQQKSLPVVKFFGKWPFKRVLGGERAKQARIEEASEP